MSMEREGAALAGRPHSQISTTNGEAATPPRAERQGASHADEQRRFALRGAVEEIGDLVARLRGHVGQSVHRGHDGVTFLHVQQAKASLTEAVRAASEMTLSTEREGGR